MRSFHRFLLVLLFVCGPVTATDSVVTVDNVPVQGIRNPQEFSFNQERDVRFAAAPALQRDKVRLAYYVQGKKLPENLNALRLDIESGDDYYPIEILPTGELKFPRIPEGKLKTAKVVANVPKGALSIVYKVDITPADAPMTLGYLREAAAQSKAGWKRAYGNALAAMTVPDFSCAKFEFTAPQAVAVIQGGKAVWSSPPEKSVQVPLVAGSVSSQAEVSFNRGSLIRIGGCKLRRGE